MDHIQKLSFTALAAIQGIGSQSIRRLNDTLIKHKLDWSEFWVLPESQLEKVAITQRQIDGIRSFKKEHTIFTYSELLQIRDIRTLVCDDEEFPKLLTQCRSSPLLLFAKGSVIQWRDRPVVAVVGTRQVTAYGLHVTKKIAGELARLNTVIVSGSMYGVDMTAHQSAITHGGQTIGVLGYGFDYYYPSGLQSVMDDLHSKGMSFYSPFAPHITPQKGHFPARNRVVAGMSQAVVVTEAAERSGSHITAGYAADEGRVVCAVPGPITNPFSVGTKSLINQGAVLVSSGFEVLQECGVGIPSPTQGQSLVHAFEPRNRITALLASGPLTTSEVCIALETDFSATTMALTNLQLQGILKKEAGRWHLYGS